MDGGVRVETFQYQRKKVAAIIKNNKDLSKTRGGCRLVGNMAFSGLR